MAVCMNPKKSFDMHHIWLASPGTLFVPILLVRCTTCTAQCSAVKKQFYKLIPNSNETKVCKL